MSSIVFPKDLIFNEETGGFEVPLGKAAGLTDAELTDAELTDARKAKWEVQKPEDRELIRQVWYMTDTLDTEMKTALEACQPGTESLRYLTQLVDIKYKV